MRTQLTPFIGLEHLSPQTERFDNVKCLRVQRYLNAYFYGWYCKKQSKHICHRTSIYKIIFFGKSIKIISINVTIIDVSFNEQFYPVDRCNESNRRISGHVKIGTSPFESNNREPDKRRLLFIS